jgi:poly-D-alanine transfer protein DltD
MITIEQKREACIKYETDWLQHGADRGDMEEIMRNGWKGWSNMSDDQVEKFYKDNIEEEV